MKRKNGLITAVSSLLSLTIVGFGFQSQSLAQLSSGKFSMEISQNPNSSSDSLLKQALKLSEYFANEDLADNHTFLNNVFIQQHSFLSQAIKADPNNAEAYYERYDIFGRYEGSEEPIPGGLARLNSDIDTYLRLRPNGENSYSAYLIRANIRAENSDYKGAESDYASAIQIMPKEYYSSRYNGYVRRGEYFMERGNYAAALSDFTSAMQLKNAGTFFEFRYQAYAKMGNFKAAIADYSQTMNKYKFYSHQYYTRALLFVKDQNWPAAIFDLTIALEDRDKTIDKYSVVNVRRDIYFERSKAYAALRQYDNAITDLNNGIALKADNNEHFYLLRARIFNALGNAELAKQDYQKALDGYRISNPDLAKQIQAEAGITSSGSGATSPSSEADAAGAGEGLDPQSTDPSSSSCPEDTGPGICGLGTGITCPI